MFDEFSTRGPSTLRWSFMSWFDWYLPAEELSCPVCGHPLTDWQGSDGPSALLVWRQGRKTPTGQRVDEELRASPWPDPGWQLPRDFVIRSFDCPCPFPVEAIGHSTDGTWLVTELIAFNNAQQYKHENRAQ
jgi:hypothetical protein